jgi:hypothetical protein
VVVSCLSAGAPARAAGNPSDQELRAAEQAYRDVDFSGTHEHAVAGLAAGGARPERVARLAVLAGMAAAALERNDDARFAFILALAVDPSLKLDRNLSPKVRGPYLEAQGYWAAHADRLSLHALTRADGTHVSARLADPAHLVSTVALSVRARGQSAFQSTRHEPDTALSLAVPAVVAAAGYDYFVRALDSYGNILAEAGDEADPLSHAPPASAAPVEASPAKPRSYVLPVTFGLLGVGAATTGVVFHLKREDAASEWNGPGCEQPGGSTRSEQCGDLEDEIRRDGRIAVASYAAAGVFFTAAVVTWFTGAPSHPDPKPDAATATTCGITGAGIACAGRF